jgi:hypothetical protein
MRERVSERFIDFLTPYPSPEKKTTFQERGTKRVRFSPLSRSE